MSPITALTTLVLLLVFSGIGQAILPPCKIGCAAPSPTTIAKVACDPSAPGGATADCVPATPAHSSSLSTAAKATTTQAPAASHDTSTTGVFTPNTQLIPPPLTGVGVIIPDTVPPSIPTLPAFSAVPPGPVLPPFSAAGPPGIQPTPAPSITAPLLLSPTSSTDPALVSGAGAGSGTALPTPSAAVAAADPADPAAAASDTAEATVETAHPESISVPAASESADGAGVGPTAFGIPLPSTGSSVGGLGGAAVASAISGAAEGTRVHLVGVASAVFAVWMLL